MRPLSVLSTITVCVIACVGIVLSLASIGVPVFLALLVVYATAIASMLLMQHHADQHCNDESRWYPYAHRRYSSSLSAGNAREHRVEPTIELGRERKGRIAVLSEA